MISEILYRRVLSEIGYKEPEDKDLDYIHNQEQSSDSSHIFIRFESDCYIRVYSDLIDFEVSMKS
ncbi:hypothetical protein MRY82_03885 [bacterium]|nr:hypothetical protein [bacterium]